MAMDVEYQKKYTIFLELCADMISTLQGSMKHPLSIYKIVAITHHYGHHHKHQI